MSIHFPVAAHAVEKRLMVLNLAIGAAGLGFYCYLKPAGALLTEGQIIEQVCSLFIGLFFIFRFINSLFTRFYIRVTKIGADLYYGPLAKRRLRRLYSQRISQVYVERNESMFGFRYRVIAITKNHKEHCLYVTYHGRLAKYLERMLEDYMGIRNSAVSGEYRGVNKADEYF